MHYDDDAFFAMVAFMAWCGMKSLILLDWV